MSFGDLDDRIPVGNVAHEVRDEHALRSGGDHRFDLCHVDLQRVGFDVDERRHDPRLHERRDVGGEGECGGDHLVARLAVEQVDGKTEG